MARKKASKVLGTVCLYGTSAAGCGYIAAATPTTGGPELFGTGELRFESFTDAMWMGLKDLRAKGGLQKGLVTVFLPDGTRMSTLSIESVWPYFGELKWEQAPVLTLSVEALVEASERA